MGAAGPKIPDLPWVQMKNGHLLYAEDLAHNRIPNFSTVDTKKARSRFLMCRCRCGSQSVSRLMGEGKRAGRRAASSVGDGNAV
jgi:hypothetical protein